MKRIIIITILCLFFLFMSTSGIAENLDLEPCINGEVSSTGLFPTQALEDEAIALANEPSIQSSHSQSDPGLIKILKIYSEFVRLAKGY